MKYNVEKLINITSFDFTLIRIIPGDSVIFNNWNTHLRMVSHLAGKCVFKKLNKNKIEIPHYHMHIIHKMRYLIHKWVSNMLLITNNF